jgi:hypothetical protein
MMTPTKGGITMTGDKAQKITNEAVSCRVRVGLATLVGRVRNEKGTD